MQRLTSSTQGVAGRGRKDLSGKILKCHYFFVVLDYCFKIQSSFLVAATARLRNCVHRIKCCYVTCKPTETLTKPHTGVGDPSCTTLLNAAEHEQPPCLKLQTMLLASSVERSDLVDPVGCCSYQRVKPHLSQCRLFETTTQLQEKLAVLEVRIAVKITLSD